MKQVYLVHELGKKYGPFEINYSNGIDAPRISLDDKSDGGYWLFFTIFEQFGFTHVEPIEPETITISKEAWKEAWKKVSGWDNRPFSDQIWQKLVEASEKQCSCGDRGGHGCPVHP